MAIIIRGSTAATVGEPILTGVPVGVFTIRGMTHGIMVMLGSTIPGTVLGMAAMVILMRMATMDMAGVARTIIADTMDGQAILCGMFIEQDTRVR